MPIVITYYIDCCIKSIFRAVLSIFARPIYHIRLPVLNSSLYTFPCLYFFSRLSIQESKIEITPWPLNHFSHLYYPKKLCGAVCCKGVNT